MKFSALGNTTGSGSKKAKKDLPVNIAMRLDRIEVAEGKPSYFSGFIVGSNEPVKVRMMTIEEGVAVNMRKGEDVEAAKARLQSQYAGTGEKHRPRPTEIANANHKAHCEAGGLLMFTKCLKSEDGTYRAHWVETLERSAGAGCDKVVAHIRAEDVKDKDKKVVGYQVVADVVNPDHAVMLTKDNLMSTLTSAFANRNGEEKRKPFVFARLVNPATGDIVLPPARANAKYSELSTTDVDTGQVFKVFEADAAEESIKNLFNPENTSQDGMVVRAAMFGLGGQGGYPEFKDANEALVKDLNSITDAVRAGSLQVEIVPGERISAGPATRASIEKAVKGNPNHPLNTLYTLRNENGYAKERRFCETFLTTKLGKDGHRYFTKAAAAVMYPTMQSIAKLATVNDHKSVSQEASLARAAEAVATEVVVNEDMALDPAHLEGLPDELDAKLTQSAQALEASFT